MLAPTSSYIRYHAVQRPAATAVISAGNEKSYAEFDADIRRMVRALRDLGLEPGACIGVQHPVIYLHLCILFAAERLEITSFSYRHTDVDLLEPFLSTLDRVFHFEQSRPQNLANLHSVSRQWVESVFSADPGPPLSAAFAVPQTQARILNSSGTTGTPKLMTLTRQNHEAWVQQYESRASFGARSRYLAAMGPPVQSFYAYTTACLRKGGLILCNPQESMAETLSNYSVTHFTCVPHTLIQMLDDLPPGYRKSADLTIFTIGAPVSETVRENARRLLGGNIVESYGTSETAVICTMRGDGTGKILPGVEVEIVDDADHPVTDGPGRVRVRSQACVSGYLNDAQADREMFRDGWFYPGDLAQRLDADTIKLVGRVDDLLNIRGVKLAPQPLEETLARDLPVDSVCLTTLPDDKNANRLWVVVAPIQADGLRELRSTIAPLLPPLARDFALVSVDAIPRTGMGKIRRRELGQELLERGLRDDSAPP